MSRSNPPRSPIAEKVRQSSGASPALPRAHPRRRRWGIRLAAAMRWLHIYTSMLGLAAVLFFSVTGLTLNHPDWVLPDAERSRQDKGTVEARWLRLTAPVSSSSAEQNDPTREVD